MDLFLCPPPTALAAMPETTCAIRWDQIQRFGIRRITGKAALTTTTILTVAATTPLLSAADSTKLVLTPKITNVLVPTNEILTEGGNDNTTLNGIPKLVGLGFTRVTGQLLNAPATTAKAIRALTPESLGSTNLEAFLYPKTGAVIGSNPSGVVYEGFPIYNLTLSDVGSEGFGKDNVYNFAFDLPPGWSEYHLKLMPTDYNPLTLVNS